MFFLKFGKPNDLICFAECQEFPDRTLEYPNCSTKTAPTEKLEYYTATR